MHAFFACFRLWKPNRIDLLQAKRRSFTDHVRGWSTTILNSMGVLYLVGNFDGLSFHEISYAETKKLVFPPGYPPRTEARYEPSTAIRQYSTGRTHVLGLADDGKVWSWTQQEARQIKLLYIDLTESNVARVVAGA